ncbi:DUF4198 domain-containing protein [Lampropedia puyangensis]|uniref:DUF4198 domain-containing protein n=2 Tax=Lampropedia puyangensis TaxID=1330072 RepID=A0A4V4GSC3_9BURK|nr:DUF4198 domain-containing protein [Lampropedia puyangensis]
MTRRVLFSLAFIFSASALQAQYLWLEPGSAHSATVKAGELHKPLTTMPTLQETKAFGAAKQALALSKGSDAFTINDIPAQGDVRFSAIEPLADGVVYYHHSKWGRSETEAINDLELVPTAAQGNTFKLVWKGRPVAASLVNVDTSEGWRRQLKANADGSITLPTPFAGLYVLEVTVRIDDGSVTIDGKKYTDVRHNATLAFEVPAP